MNFNKFLNMIFKFPLLNIIIILGLTLFFSFWLQKAKIDNDVTTMIPKSHPSYIANNKMEDEFGGTSVILVGIKAKSGTIFTVENIKAVDEITRKIEDVKYPDENNLEPETSGETSVDYSNILDDMVEDESDQGSVSESNGADYSDLLDGMLDDSAEAEGLVESKDSNVRPELIDNIVSITNADLIEGKEGAIEPISMSDILPKNEEELFLFKQKVFSWDLYKDNLYSKNLKACSVLVTVGPDTKTPEHEIIYKHIKSVLSEYEDGNFEFYISGYPAIATLVGEYMVKDLVFLIPFVVLVVLVILMLSFQSVGGVALPLITVIISTLWAMGIMSLAGKNITIITTCIPVVLVAVGSAYGIHIISHYYDEIKGKNRSLTKDEHKEIIFHVLKNIGLPVILAALTTSVGFASLISSEIIPLRDFGAFSTVGVITAVVVSLLFIPSLLLMRHKSLKSIKVEDANKETLLTKALIGIYHFFIAKKARLMIFVLIILVVSIVGVLRVNTDTAMINNFKSTSAPALADKFLNENFAGTELLDIRIEGLEDGDLADPEILKKMDELSVYLTDKYLSINKVVGFHDFIKRMNKVMHYPEDGSVKLLSEKKFITLLNNALVDAGNTNITLDEFVQLINREYNFEGENFYEIPYEPKKYNLETHEELKRLITQYLLLYSGDLDSYAGPDVMQPKIARMTIILDDTNSSLSRGLIKDIKTFAKNNFPEGCTVLPAGGIDLNLAVNDLIIKGQLWSLLFSLLAVFLIITISFRSVIAGLIGTVPLSFSVLINFGVMGFFGISLNIGTAMIASLAIGIGVDYTIHFMAYYHNQRKLYDDLEKVTKNTLVASGKAIVFNASAVGLGFAVLTLSQFVPLINIGFLVAIVMLTSSLGAMTLLPALLNIVKPKFVKK